MLGRILHKSGLEANFGMPKHFYANTWIEVGSKGRPPTMFMFGAAVTIHTGRVELMQKAIEEESMTMLEEVET